MSGRPPLIPPAFDLRHFMREGVNERGRAVGRFETYGAMLAERAMRIKTLRRWGDHAAQMVALTLENCQHRRHCRSLACPVCARWRRLETGAAVLKFLQPFPVEELRFVTLIDPRDQLRRGQLADFDPLPLIARYRRGIERAGFNKAQMFLIGGLDGEWDASRESYQLHHHLIGWNVPDDLLKKVIAQWPRDADRVRVRKRAQPITDLPRVIAYLDKGWWPGVHRGDGDDGRLFTRKCRLPPEIECEFLTWMNSNRSCDLRLWLGVKSYKGKIRWT